MIKRKIFRNLILCGALILSFSVLSCGPKFIINRTYLVKGNCAVTDLADGKITINYIQAYPKFINIYFSNDRVLTIYPRKRARFDINDNIVSVYYHGHFWPQENEPDKDRKDIILKMDEVCFDDAGNTFYIKFSTDFKIYDCEKPVLSFSCNKLLAQNDMEWYLKKLRIMTFMEEEKAKDKIKKK